MWGGMDAIVEAQGKPKATSGEMEAGSELAHRETQAKPWHDAEHRHAHHAVVKTIGGFHLLNGDGLAEKRIRPPVDGRPFYSWCPRPELNQRRRDFQSLALPTELQGRGKANAYNTPKRRKKSTAPVSWPLLPARAAVPAEIQGLSCTRRALRLPCIS